MIIVGVVLFLLVVIHHHWRNRNAVVTNWPVVGMLPTLLLNVPRLHDFVTEILRRSGGTFEFKGPWFAGMDFIITCDPLNLQHITTTNFSNYPKGEEFREVLDVLGDGILNVDSDLWKLQRKMFQLWSRRHDKFDSFVARALQRKVVDDLIPFLDHVCETGIQVDLQEAFQRMITFDNAIFFIFGFDLASHSFKFSQIEYQKAFGDMQEAVLRRHFLPKHYWKLQRRLQIGTERKLRIAQQIFDEFVYRCISLKREEMHGNKSEHVEEANLGLLTIYMEEKENPYSDKFLKDVAFSFLAAARDTLNAGFCWFFWLVTTHPHIETKILEEMKAKLPSKLDDHDHYNGSFTIEELNKLVYLQATIYETFRLYPSVPFNHRTPTKADILPSGHHVKQKQMVLTSVYSTGRMEEIWGKDCLEFKPERWISERGEFVYVPSHKYAAFHAGPRTCMGKDMALIQMKVMAITVLRKYRFEVVEGHPVSPHLMVTLNMKYGLKVRIFKRCD